MWLDQQEELHSFGPFMSRIRIDGLGRAVFFDMVTSDCCGGDGFTLVRFETTVTFSGPGTYTFRAYGCDSMAVAPADLLVTVVVGD